MVINRNSSTAEEIRDVLKLQQNVDGIISNVAGQIIPVVDVNPKHSRLTTFCIVSQKTTSGTSEIMTTDPKKQFYLTGITYSITKNAACDLASGYTLILAYIMNQQVAIASLSTLTLTAQDKNMSISFNNPIPIDKNTAISFNTNTFAAGDLIRVANLYGFYVENAGA